MSQKVVILDPGHGGINPLTRKYVTAGKRSPLWADGSVYFEGVGNREIVKVLARMLVAAGVKVLYTVSPDDYHDVALSKRVRTANSHYRNHPNAFLVSVHSNGASPKAHGAEVWTWPGQSPADPMADIWMKEHKKAFPSIALRTDKSDGDLDKESKFTINSVNCPSFLVETMFHTNEKECKILMSSAGQFKIARALYNTILKIER